MVEMRSDRPVRQAVGALLLGSLAGQGISERLGSHLRAARLGELRVQLGGREPAGLVALQQPVAHRLINGCGVRRPGRATQVADMVPTLGAEKLSAHGADTIKPSITAQTVPDRVSRFGIVSAGCSETSTERGSQTAAPDAPNFQSGTAPDFGISAGQASAGCSETSESIESVPDAPRLSLTCTRDTRMTRPCQELSDHPALTEVRSIRHWREIGGNR